ncbi:MAG TPA: response regulator [Myxococcales bacterium]|nr:response regulator [Myxococcales bacterium]
MHGGEAIVIEDDRDARRLVADCLRRMGLHVLEAESAGEGSALLDRTIPSLICLDLRLPDRCGLSVCEQVRSSARLRDVPVLVITARSLALDRARAEVAGADDYIVKPFRAAALTRSVRELMALSAVAAS